MYACRLLSSPAHTAWPAELLLLGGALWRTVVVGGCVLEMVGVLGAASSEGGGEGSYA
jgi:hypothetical protein